MSDLTSLIDRHTERWVMDHVFVKCNVSLCLRYCKKPDSFTVIDEAIGQKYGIFARSVNHPITWRACLRAYAESSKEEIDTTSYRSVGLRIQTYEHYLLHKPRSPYLFIASEQDMNAFHDMVVFSAIIRTTEERYAERRIVDPEVWQQVALRLAERENTALMAKAVGHARKHDEDIQGAIGTAYRESLERLEEVATALTWKEPLPALPEGTTHALAWLEMR